MNILRENTERPDGCTQRGGKNVVVNIMQNKQIKFRQLGNDRNGVLLSAYF